MCCHEMSNLLFSQAGIGLSKVNRGNGICHGILAGVFETELFNFVKATVNKS